MSPTGHPWEERRGGCGGPCFRRTLATTHTCRAESGARGRQSVPPHPHPPLATPVTYCAPGPWGGRSTARAQLEQAGLDLLGPSPPPPRATGSHGDRRGPPRVRWGDGGEAAVYEAGRPLKLEEAGTRPECKRLWPPTLSPKEGDITPLIRWPCHSPWRRPKAYRAPAASPPALAHAPGAAHSDLCVAVGSADRLGERGTLRERWPAVIYSCCCCARWHRKSRVSREKTRRGFSRSPFPLQTARVSSWGLNIWET